MSDIQVTRRDREMLVSVTAFLAHGDEVSAEAREWVHTGAHSDGTDNDVARFLDGASRAIAQARAEGFAAGKAAALEVAREVSCRLLFLNDAEDLVDAVTEELAQKEPENV